MLGSRRCANMAISGDARCSTRSCLPGARPDSRRWSLIANLNPHALARESTRCWLRRRPLLPHAQAAWQMSLAAWMSGISTRVEVFIEKRETRGRRFEICAVRIACAGGDTGRSKDAPAAHLCPPFGDGMGTLRSPFFLAPSYGCIRQFHRRSS